MTQKSTVLIVAPYFPPHTGGLERYAYEVGKGLARDARRRVVVLTSSETGNDVVEGVGGMTVYRLRYTLKISNTPFSFSWLWKVPRLLRDIAPDLIDVHMPVPGIGDVAALCSKTVPVVVHYHGGSMRKGRFFIDTLIGAYEYFVLPFVLGKARHIVCSSDFVRDSFLARYVHKSSTLPPATDAEQFSPCDSAPVHPTLVFVGGLGSGEEHKGLRTVIDRLPQLCREVPELHLVVAGEGDRCASFQAQAKRLGVADRVSFVGKKLGKDMAAVYQNGTVFVLPTTNDSFPTVILEAMACGLPVVSTRVGSIPVMVEDGATGYLVGPEDTQGFAEKVKQVLLDRETAARMGRNGREKILAGYSWTVRVESHATLYRSLLEQRPHLAHVVGYYPPHLGGMEVVAAELAHETARRGYPTRVYTSTVGAAGVPRTERRTNLIIRRLRSFEWAHTPVIPSLLFHLLRVQKPCILHVHIAQVGIPELALLAAMIRKLPFVAHFHLDVAPSGRLGPLFILYKRYVLGVVLRRADQVVAFSAEQAQFLTDRYGVVARRISVIPNGVHASLSADHARTLTSGTLRLLSVGRLTNQKRIDRVIEALPLLSVPAHLTVVGDGEDRGELEELAERVAPQMVTFMGYQTPEGVRKQMADAHIFVLPSDREGMPLSALEAMAAGLPVVGANVMGVRELVGGVGILVDRPSPVTFARAIDALAHDADRYAIVAEQSITCAAAHSWQSVVNALERVYAQV